MSFSTHLFCCRTPSEFEVAVHSLDCRAQRMASLDQLLRSTCMEDTWICAKNHGGHEEEMHCYCPVKNP